MAVMRGVRGWMTATVTPAPAKDSFGDPSGDPAASWSIEGCLFAPGETVEQTDRADTVITTGVLYAPPGSSVPKTATVTVDGFTGQVHGDTDSWPGGVAVRLRRVTG